VTRIDKYLWAVRLFKTRSQASEQVKNGKITVNDEVVKAAKELKQGDIIRIKKNTAHFSYKVIEILENRVGGPLVKNYLEDITPESEIEKYKEYQLAQRDYRDFSFGKPSKSDRRKRNKFLGE
jgi:ribosome-associated heat shock protein Hsp15